MKIKVVYPVVRETEIKIPESLAKAYKEAEGKDDFSIDAVNEKIYHYLENIIPKIDADADYKPDIYDWDIIE